MSNTIELCTYPKAISHLTELSNENPIRLMRQSESTSPRRHIRFIRTRFLLPNYSYLYAYSCLPPRHVVEPLLHRRRTPCLFCVSAFSSSFFFHRYRHSTKRHCVNNMHTSGISLNVSIATKLLCTLITFHLPSIWEYWENINFISCFLWHINNSSPGTWNLLFGNRFMLFAHCLYRLFRKCWTDKMSIQRSKWMWVCRVMS